MDSHPHDLLTAASDEARQQPMTPFDASSADPPEGTRLQYFTEELQALQARREQLKGHIAAQQQQCRYLLGLGRLFAHSFLSSTFRVPSAPKAK
jgi:hypothetical protein